MVKSSDRSNLCRTVRSLGIIVFLPTNIQTSRFCVKSHNLFVLQAHTQPNTNNFSNRKKILSYKISNSKNTKKELSEIDRISESLDMNLQSQKLENIPSNEQDHLDAKVDITNFLNKVSDTLEKKYPDLRHFNSKMDNIANTLNVFFEDKNTNFEWYQRAGKFFIRCEHKSDEKYSQEMRNVFESLIENKMERTDTHYIVTPNSASIVFR